MKVRTWRRRPLPLDGERQLRRHWAFGWVSSETRRTRGEGDLVLTPTRIVWPQSRMEAIWPFADWFWRGGRLRGVLEIPIVTLTGARGDAGKLVVTTADTVYRFQAGWKYGRASLGLGFKQEVLDGWVADLRTLLQERPPGESAPAAGE